MKLEYYEITAALAAGNYGQAVDHLLAQFWYRNGSPAPP